jgi:putative transposase
VGILCMVDEGGGFTALADRERMRSRSGASGWGVEFVDELDEDLGKLRIIRVGAQLHHDNLVALAESCPDLKPVPSYATLRRFLKANGLAKRRRVTSRRTDGAARAEARFLDHEVRRYEAEYVGGLWHYDAHVGSRKVLTPRGEWVTPILFGVLDDRSRLACHPQWYLSSETAEIVVHGLSQAFQKRGLPRAGSSDNGAAMTAAEVVEGLTRLGILQATTLPYTPAANAKIEIL